LIKNIPINKGNYSIESPERDALFDEYRGQGWKDEYRCYRENWEKHPKSFFVAEYPLLVDLELSSLCNLRCPMCYTITNAFKQKVHVGFMDFQLFKKIVDEISGNVPAIRLSLRGEPTLHPEFINAIKYAKCKGIREVSCLTNGSMLTEDFSAKVIDADIDWITISVDGLGKTYENIRHPLKFREIFSRIKNIQGTKKKLHKNKPLIKIQAIWPSIRENPEDYYNTFSPYVDLIAFNPLIDYLGKDEDIVYDDDFSCPQLYQRLVVGSDGHVMMCSNDEEGENIVGNANLQTIKEIWHGEKLFRMRVKQKSDKGFLDIKICKKCYLPRKTADNETACINGRRITIKNYINRIQRIGE
jgi:radical SAM protein with 4Fe4S-binding SPASM domain